MSGSNPSGWVDKVVSWCFGLLGATMALYCAVLLIQAMLPVLIVIAGVVGLIGIGIVVYRTTRNGW